MDVRPSGRQFEISWRDQRASIVEVGGGMRQHAVAGRPVLDPCPSSAICDGAPLITWPSRLADGRYRFDGAGYQVALTEPGKQSAIHGFPRRRPWQAVLQTQTQVMMATRLLPTDGYPFLLYVKVDYALGEEGLSVATTAANGGGHPYPYGAGQHRSRARLGGPGGLRAELRADEGYRIIEICTGDTLAPTAGAQAWAQSR